MAVAQGDHSAARALLEEALPIHREFNEPRGIAQSLRCLAVVHLDQGDYLRAQVALEEALDVQRQHGDRDVAEALELLAALGVAKGRVENAARIWGCAGQLREELGTPIRPSQRLWYDRYVDRARAASRDEAAFELAWQEGRAMALEQAIRYALGSELAGGTKHPK